jgi:NDP-sugar pyrophosphorylase family protein
MEALVLAGGRAERLGDAAAGLPKPLVPVAGRPLVAWTLARLPADRVILACAAGEEERFVSALGDLGPEIVAVGEPEPLGRGGGLRFAAASRREDGPVFALNGDEVLDLDFVALLAFHEESGAAATIVVCPLVSQFGVVELDGDRVTGFTESPRLPHWVNAGAYVLGEEALARLPERGDHEQTTFPELAAEGRLAAFRHEGLWLTVNTPKDLRRAEETLAGVETAP